SSSVDDVSRSLPVERDDGTRKYVWGRGLAYAVDTAGNVEVYHTDGLGSVRAITNALGEVVQTCQTDEFGIATLTEGYVSQPFQYTGEQRDGESGLVYLRARMYDPQIGRFLQRDPLIGAIRSPLSLNRFGYALANPLSFVDPSGFEIARILKTDGRGAADNECFSSGGGEFGGNVVFVSCLNTPVGYLLNKPGEGPRPGILQEIAIGVYCP
ncbi:MAG: RHS repeat-associated core domain-containing protein, partial [Chloroflexi bacterium]|nr:RHS repeat-associated core domain-containing protein [Chloroflexota bacterium]